MQVTGVQSLGLEDPLKKEMAINSSFLAWEFHGQMSLGGHGPWRHKRDGQDLATKQQQYFIIIIFYNLRCFDIS